VLGLEGRTNVQGRTVAEGGAMVLYLERGRSVREDAAHRGTVLATRMEADLASRRPGRL
jgi:hypothetical protein